MPKAFGQKFSYRDHDTDRVNQVPPVLNKWYTVFDADDVRLLWCRVVQTNDEAAAKTIEVRWTIDGNVYLVPWGALHNTAYWIYRIYQRSLGGTQGLWQTTFEVLGALYTCKRGQDFKVEIRITSALGTNQLLLCECVRETLELT